MILNQEKVITGNVAILKFYISIKDSKINDNEETNLYNITQEYQEKLKVEIEENIKGILGSQFDLVKFEIRKGSVEVILIIGTTYVVISRYKNFVESLKILKNQLENIFRRFYNRGQNFPNISIDSSLTLGAGLTDAKAVFDINMYNFVVLYLILTNLILIGTLIYLAVK